MSAPANHESGKRRPVDRRPVFYGGRKIPNLSVYTLQDGTDVYDVRLRMPDGSQPRVKLENVHTPTDAVRERDRLLVDRDRGVAYENRLLNPTVADLLEEMHADMQARIGVEDRKFGVAPATLTCHRANARNHIVPFFGRQRVADVAISDVRRFASRLVARGLAAYTVRSIVGQLSVALTFAQERGYVERNVVRDLPRSALPSSKRQTEPRYLTMDEVERLLAASEDGFRSVFACCAYAALRIAEVLGLRWRDIDFDAGTLTVAGQVDDMTGEWTSRTKTESSAAVLPLAPALRRELLAQRSRLAQRGLQFVKPNAPVHPAAHGRPLRDSTTMGALRRAGNRAGLNPEGAEKIGHHDLRHSAAAIALQLGVPVNQVAEMMRHESAATTVSTYSGLTAEGKGAAMRRMLEGGFGA